MYKYLLIVFLTIISCNKATSDLKIYNGRTADGKDSARLEIKLKKNNFYGHYKVYYHDKTMDSGTVTGSKIGDTLKGRFTYVSRHNARDQKPIALLQDGKNLKLGIGEILTGFNIPFYEDGSITFPDSLLYFNNVQ